MTTLRGIMFLLAVTAAQAQSAVPASTPMPAPVTTPTSTPTPTSSGIDTETPSEDVAFEARVAAYLLSPEGGVAGLVFDDGRQVFVPPVLGDRLAALVQPGQQARVGPRREEERGPGSVRTITAAASGATLGEKAPGEGRPAPRAADGSGSTLQAMQAGGSIRLRLHGPRGETNGLLLDTGTQVFFPPHVAIEAGDALRPGRTVKVDGYGRTSAYGTVIQATTLTGPDGRAVVVYGSPTSRPRR